MKLTCEYVILAERILHDSLTDTVSAIGLVEVVAATEFPSQMFGFGVFARFRAAVAPSVDVLVQFRVVRVSEHDGERAVADLDLLWKAGTSFARVATNFKILGLVRPERLRFRVDYRLDGADWVMGPATSVDIVHVPTASSDPGADPS